MNIIRIPGLSDFIEGAAAAFQKFADALRGYEIHRSALVKRGEPVRFEDQGRVIVSMHPLDAIEIENRDDPEIWLDEALGWITERAHRELDSILVEATNRANLGKIRQAERMTAFCREHGISNPWILTSLSAIDGSKIIASTLDVGTIRGGAR